MKNIVYKFLKYKFLCIFVNAFNFAFMLKKIQKLLHLASQIDEVKIANQTAIREEILNYCALNSQVHGITDQKYGSQEIIISLTTYDKRLSQVYLTIESLMQQSMKANKIVLWLSDEYAHQTIPPVLQQQQNRGLEINFCQDIRSYKKLIPSLKKYPDALIITADDDLYYHPNMIENLVFSYLKDPHFIYFNRGFTIRLKNHLPIPYKKWESITHQEVSPLNFPTSGGGVLYPPKCFNEEVFNEAVFSTLCPWADDVWFKAMSLYNGTPSKKAVTLSPVGDEFLVNKSVQNSGLKLINNGQNQNDVQIKNVFDKYDLYPLLTVCR